MVITRDQAVFSFYGSKNIHGWNIYWFETRLFCFGCRHFAPSGSGKVYAFATNRFPRWKKAQHSKYGFKKHVKSRTHNSSLMLWTELKRVVDQSTSVHHIASKACEKKYTKTDIILNQLNKFCWPLLRVWRSREKSINDSATAGFVFSFFAAGRWTWWNLQEKKNCFCTQKMQSKPQSKCANTRKACMQWGKNTSNSLSEILPNCKRFKTSSRCLLKTNAAECCAN